MVLGLLGSTADIGKTLLNPLELDNSLRNTVQNKVLNDTQTVSNFVRKTNESLGHVFATQLGLSTALNQLSLHKENPSSDKQFDGQKVGANGQMFAPDTPLSEIPAVTPTGGIRNHETLLYINGLRTNVAGQANSLQAIADNSGSRVIGVHNAAENFVGDLVQSLGDKLDIGNNPAVDTLASTIYQELTAGREVHLMAHSQGTIITSRALQDVKNRLMLEDGMSRNEVERLIKKIIVETFGGAARSYPDGPQYVHYINRNDGVPQAFGLPPWLNPFAQAGNDAVMHYFRKGKPFVSHGFEEFYLPERVPFDEVRAR